MNTPYIISSENAARIADWLATRGGVAVWTSVDLSDPGFSLITPAQHADGSPTAKPHWKLGTTPARIITDAEEIVVSVNVAVKRFHVGVRMGGQGLALKVTDGGTRRIRREVAKAGEGAFYQFDYMTQEAVIFKPSKTMPLASAILERSKEAGAL